MSYLNADERQKLAQELVNKKFGAAKWKLQHMDPEGRIKFFRNTQRVGYLMTRYELPTYGVLATLYEKHSSSTDPITSKINAKNTLAEVVVEPTTDNKS
jgi:hypothetical protein